jgi:hypothetical protein
MRRRLNELTPYLTKLLSNENYVYNNTNFQQDDSKIETCGDHVCAFLYSFKNYNMDLEHIQEYIEVFEEISENDPTSYIVRNL